MTYQNIGKMMGGLHTRTTVQVTCILSLPSKFQFNTFCPLPLLQFKYMGMHVCMMDILCPCCYVGSLLELSKAIMGRSLFTGGRDWWVGFKHFVLSSTFF